MNRGERRSDLISFRRALLDSARLDVQPVPESVRKKLLVAASIAGVTSATAGSSAAWGAISSPLVIGVTKWLAVGTLLVSAGAGTFHATRGVWHSPAPAMGGAAAEHSKTEHPKTEYPKRVDQPSNHVATATSPSSRPEPIQPSYRRSVDVGLAESSESASGPQSAVRSSIQPEPITSRQPLTDSTVPRDPSTVVQDVPFETDVAESATADELPKAKSLASLTLELGFLDRARSRLAAGDPNGTLASLDAYAREFPAGNLQPEAMLLRIQALHQSGQRKSAREAGLRFLRQYPTSPHANRIRALIRTNQERDDG